MVTHVLRNGQQVKDIKGRKVKKKDVPQYFELVNRVKRSHT